MGERLKELGLGWLLQSVLKHLPGRHPQSRHAGTRSGAVRAAAEEFEARYMQLDRLHLVEGGRLISADGEVLWENMEGEKSGLDIPGAAHGGRKADSTFTHYHPPIKFEGDGTFGDVERGQSSLPPSTSDYQFAEQFNLAEMRVVGWDGQRPVRYVVTRPKGGWPRQHSFFDSYFDEMDKLTRKHKPPLDPGQTSAYGRKLMDLAWKKASKVHGIGYEVEYVG
jgi:hypothetical protein